jgi:hypothetical protein
VPAEESHRQPRRSPSSMVRRLASERGALPGGLPPWTSISPAGRGLSAGTAAANPPGNPTPCSAAGDQAELTSGPYADTRRSSGMDRQAQGLGAVVAGKV